MKAIILISVLAIVYSVPPPSVPLDEFFNNLLNDDSFSIIDQGSLIQADPTFNIGYLLYTRENKLHPDVLLPGDLGELLINGTAHRGTIFIFHGFTSNGYADWVQDMKDELLLVDNFNVIVVNWREGAKGPLNLYFKAAQNTRIVGQRTAKLIQAIYSITGIGPDQMHLIGHSLGAHCAGFTGKRIFELTWYKPSRISGLDPAGPRFAHSQSGQRLDKTDAYFVDIIHTNDGKLGWLKNSPLGHVDFYPNGGSKQPGCQWDISGACAHGRATELYVHSIRTCPFLTRPGAAVCPGGPDTELQMGYHAYSYTLLGTAPATHCLETTGTAPYCDNPIRVAARKLRAAVTGLGTDEAAIIDVVTHHTYEEKIQIGIQYYIIYDRVEFRILG